MRIKFILALIGVCLFSEVMAQDCSNILYYDPYKLDNSLLGKFCHIDFGEISFGGKVIDTLEIEVNGQRMKFYEHRVDNGFDNWFNKQYLIRVSNEKHSTARLLSSKIDSLTTDRIYLTSILSYYSNESPIDTITVFQHWFDKKNISKVLIKK